MRKEPKKDTERSGEAKLPLRKRLIREVLAWTWVLAAFLLIHGTLVHGRVIPSPSMERTILVGDHVLVSRFGYDAEIPFTGWHVSLWRDPERQHVIIFRGPHPGAPEYVKRVIGVPGDTVEIRAGAAWVNGRPLDEPYLEGTPDRSENFGPVQVPPASYFVMGDNRNNSYDSRYWGFVPRSAVVGTPLIIYLSLEGPGEPWQSVNLRDRLGAYGGAVIHPSRVRWQRLFLTF